MPCVPWLPWLKAPGDYELCVNHHGFGMGDAVGGINGNWDAGVPKEGKVTVRLVDLVLFENA